MTTILHIQKWRWTCDLPVFHFPSTGIVLSTPYLPYVLLGLCVLVSMLWTELYQQHYTKCFVHYFTYSIWFLKLSFIMLWYSKLSFFDIIIIILWLGNNLFFKLSSWQLMAAGELFFYRSVATGKLPVIYAHIRASNPTQIPLKRHEKQEGRKGSKGVGRGWGGS